MKLSKILACVATVATATLYQCGCGGWGGWGDFAEGLLRDGWVDNRYFDIVTDWLWEDLIIG